MNNVKIMGCSSLKAFFVGVIAGSLLGGLSGCGPQPEKQAAQNGVAQGEAVMVGLVNTDRVLNIDTEPGQWLMAGRGFSQQYFSPLSYIDKSNVNTLGFAWEYQIDTTLGFEATPIVVDGVMFSSGPKGAVYALDAATGVERWTYQPEIEPQFLRKVCCGPHNRGVAVWNGLVYVATLDGHLLALDADDGAVVWKQDTFVDRARGYASTGAPYIANRVVVIGNAGADLDARGYVTAYDLQTGEQRWRFFTVPGNPELGFEHPELELAARTWDPDSLWQVGLGGTVWDGMAYDPESNLLYIGTGNGAPHPHTLRSPKGGDNLFLSSIIALNPDNGRMAWYYQTTPGDSWDYTAAQKFVMADLEIEGQVRQVIMQAPKNGFFYVLDRKTGELISAKPYVQVNWASHVDPQTGRPVFTGMADYADSPKLVFPSFYGGHNWQPMSYSPKTQLVYLPAMEMARVFAMPAEPFAYKEGSFNVASRGYLVTQDEGNYVTDAAKDEFPPLDVLNVENRDVTVRSFLRALDPKTQQIAWQVETSGPWAGTRPASWNGGGVMSTAGGLVFQGRGTGELVVLDAETGDKLHGIDVGTGMTAAPMTYTVNGEQYVAIMAGVAGSLGQIFPPGSAGHKYGNGGRIVAFKLGGGKVPHPEPKQEVSVQTASRPPVPRVSSLGDRALGKALFERHCASCHLNAGVDGRVPDLRYMEASTHDDFENIVLRGSRSAQGMGSFAGVLSTPEVDAIRGYLIDLAWDNYKSSLQPAGQH
jgi:quinohemoprotein ethanol dehydrogenase